MLREDLDDRPEEVSGATGLQAKSDYIREMEKLEKVENATFSRMNMSKAQKKYHKKMMEEGNQERFDKIDELRDIEDILYRTK